MQIALVGCGFVADFYMLTLRNYPELQVAGVYDRDPARGSRFAKHYGTVAYSSLDGIFEDAKIELVLNLTNPRSHFAVTKACLEAGKHVYSEKPLSMDLDEAKMLVELAQSLNLYLSGAPCSVLGECAQTIWHLLRKDAVGSVRLVYAELDDGLVHRMRYRNWLSESGTQWPYRDEFEIGCTLEHAGYYVTWLVAFFGAAKAVTRFAACLIPDKETDVELGAQGADFSLCASSLKAAWLPD